MPIIIDNVAELDRDRFKKEISTGTEFVMIDNIRKKDDLHEKTLLAKVVKSSNGKHPKKGRYYRLLLTDLFSSDETSAKKISLYLYHKYAFTAAFQCGDFVAVSNAAIIAAPGSFYPTDYDHPYEIVCQHQTSNSVTTTPATLRVMTKSLPTADPFQPPSCANRQYNYTLIKDVKEDDRCNIFAYVIDKRTTVKTKGKSFLCQLFVKDTSQRDDESDFSVSIFISKEDDLPEVNVNDVASFHRAHIRRCNNRLTANVYEGYHCMFWSGKIGASLRPRTSAKKFSVTAIDVTKLEELRRFFQKHNVVTHHQPVVPLLPSAPKPPPSVSLSSITTENYFDLTCQVVEVFNWSQNVTTLRVWDGTNPSVNFRRCIDGNGHQFSEIHDKIEDLTVDAWVYGEHYFTAAKLQTGDVVLFKNLHSRLPLRNGDGQLQLELHSGKTYGRSIITLDKTQSDPLKRKLELVLAERIVLNETLQQARVQSDSEHQNKRHKPSHNVEVTTATSSITNEPSNQMRRIPVINDWTPLDDNDRRLVDVLSDDNSSDESVASEHYLTMTQMVRATMTSTNKNIEERNSSLPASTEVESREKTNFQSVFNKWCLNNEVCRQPSQECLSMTDEESQSSKTKPTENIIAEPSVFFVPESDDESERSPVKLPLGEAVQIEDDDSSSSSVIADEESPRRTSPERVGRWLLIQLNNSLTPNESTNDVSAAEPATTPRIGGDLESGKMNGTAANSENYPVASDVLDDDDIICEGEFKKTKEFASLIDLTVSDDDESTPEKVEKSKSLADELKPRKLVNQSSSKLQPWRNV